MKISNLATNDVFLLPCPSISFMVNSSVLVIRGFTLSKHLQLEVQYTVASQKSLAFCPLILGFIQNVSSSALGRQIIGPLCPIKIKSSAYDNFVSSGAHDGLLVSCNARV